MRSLLTALPSVFWLLTSICEANPLKHYDFGTRDAQDADLDTLNETLWRRVRVPGGTGNNAPPPVDQIFLFGSSTMTGGCSGQKSLLQDWLDDSRRVQDAIEQLYAIGVTKPSVSKLWETFFGIFSSINPTTHQFEVHPDSRDRWNAIGDHIARVTQFLDGNGLREPVVAGEVPRIYCSGDAGQLVGWDTILKDENGKEVEKGTDPVTGQTQYVSLREVYPSNYPNIQNAYWMSSFNGYWFTGTKDTSLCPAAGRQAATGRPAVPPLRGLNVKLAQANRGIIICPKAWQRQIGQPHGQPSLLQAVGGTNYPTGDGSNKESLAVLVPMSMTLYHEIVHLTDYNKQTSERDTYPLGTILKMAYSTDATEKRVVPHNPETYVHFGIAAYVYLNPPQGKDTILYVGGKSATETAVWNAISNKRHQGP